MVRHDQEEINVKLRVALPPLLASKSRSGKEMKEGTMNTFDLLVGLLRRAGCRFMFVMAFFLASPLSVCAGDGNFVWARAMGGGEAGTSQENVWRIAVDSAGNVYTVGYFYGTADFDPGPGTANLTSVGAYDVFISKLDSGGNYVWARSFGGPALEYGFGLAVDASGNVYTSGKFVGTVDFDPGPGTAILNGLGVSDIFISKLDNNGNYVWARSMGGVSGQGFSHGIAVDPSGNVYTTGFFTGTVDFNPGTGTFNLMAGSNTDIFVSKLTGDGVFVWAKAMHGSPAAGYGYDITLDPSGNVYTTGYFYGTIDFDPGTGTANLMSAGGSDIFISKLNNDGNHVWARTIGGASGDAGRQIDVDSTGAVYTTGYFRDIVDFDPGSGISNLASAGGIDIFISKLDNNGNYVWARSMGGNFDDYGNGLDLDDSGNVVATGFFMDTVDFDPGPGVNNLVSAGGDDIFISKLDNSGNFLWAKGMGGTLDDGGIDIAVDTSGAIHTTGFFMGTVDFDPGPGNTSLSCAGQSDIFIVKLASTPDEPAPFPWTMFMPAITKHGQP
jgi:hypothetical protein